MMIVDFLGRREMNIFLAFYLLVLMVQVVTTGGWLDPASPVIKVVLDHSKVCLAAQAQFSWPVDFIICSTWINSRHVLVTLFEWLCRYEHMKTMHWWLRNTNRPSFMQAINS
jgi:hypothetical protein